MNKIEFDISLNNSHKKSKQKKSIKIIFSLIVLIISGMFTYKFVVQYNETKVNSQKNLAVNKVTENINIKNKLDYIINDRIPIITSIYNSQTFTNEINLINDFILNEDEENALIALNSLEKSVENNINLIKANYSSLLNKEISRAGKFKDEYTDKLIKEINSKITEENFEKVEYKINILKYKVDNLLYDNGQTNTLNPLILDGIIIVNKNFGLPINYGTDLEENTIKAFEEMEAAAAKDGISLYIASGFRNYYKQDSLFYDYYAQYGEEAKRFSSIPGHSEHQTGLAIDIGGVDDYLWVKSDFYNTEEYKWLEKNCYKYGFILRYPDNKEDITGYMFESWHYRYVGTELSTYLHKNNLTLEEYFDID
jgi:D-alanyl-D-alanine carboxypeptidase